MSIYLIKLNMLRAIDGLDKAHSRVCDNKQTTEFTDEQVNALEHALIRIYSNVSNLYQVLNEIEEGDASHTTDVAMLQRIFR